MTLPLALTPACRAHLEAHAPGVAALEVLRHQYLSGDLSVARNRVEGRVEPPHEGDLRRATEAVGAEARRIGRQALAEGRAGLVLLNGGMATRFGGSVKGAVEVDGGLSFLGLKLRDALRAADEAGAVPPPVLIMNSQATAAATETHLAANGWFGYPAERVWMFTQSWTARLTPSGDLFFDSEGDPLPSCYGMGHGDLAPCLRTSGLLARFSAGGGETLLMSNVDNAAATLDAGLLGAHRAAGVELTVELVEKYAGDAGGAPARVNGRLQIVEGFRFPTDFDAARIPVFNTNTLWLQVSALSREAPLPIYAVEKQVDGRTAVQFERLVGELSAHCSTQYLVVPRVGVAGRFLPVKSPADLPAARAALRALRDAQGAG